MSSVEIQEKSTIPGFFPRNLFELTQDDSSRHMDSFEFTQESLSRHKRSFDAKFNHFFQPGNLLDKNKTSFSPNITHFDATQNDLLRIKHSVIFSNDSARDLVQTPEARLEDFVGYLKSLINLNDFDFATFEVYEKSLRTRLLEIERFADISKYTSIELKSRLRFAKYMFEVMVSSVQGLKLYGKMRGLVSHLMYCMISLNVRLLAMFDLHGFPDPAIPGFTKTVPVQMAYLEFWKQMFAKLTGVSLGETLSFDHQYNKAEYTLAVLSRHISNREGKDL
ncbi:hypothetical protein JCM33374_g2020 [Metschnikowia sp. JCM 33374]|nr:hypothetical protein JCM33374_g2020 [Metschnikowia sp. JCM 33374]